MNYSLAWEIIGHGTSVLVGVLFYRRRKETPREVAQDTHNQRRYGMIPPRTSHIYMASQGGQR